MAVTDTDSLKSELEAKTSAPASTATTTSTVQTGVSSVPAYADQNRVAALNQMYDANINSQRANLESAYNQNMSDLEANRNKIAQQYQTQRNAFAADYERNRRNFNQQAIMNGINTGAASQAALAQNAAYGKGQAAIGASEAAANTDLNKSIADLKVKYQGDINAAIAQNDYNRAAALLDEYNNTYSMAMTKAQSLAQYGDFSGYADIYGQDAANQMGEVWSIQNPLIAYSLGRITADKYKQITGTYPPAYRSGGGGGGRRGVTPPAGYTAEELSKMAQEAFDSGMTHSQIYNTFINAGMTEDQLRNSGITYYDTNWGNAVSMNNIANGLRRNADAQTTGR